MEKGTILYQFCCCFTLSSKFLLRQVFSSVLAGILNVAPQDGPYHEPKEEYAETDQCPYDPLKRSIFGRV